VQSLLLNIEIAHSLAVASLPWHHRDPFDRLLVCQSKLEDLPILGRDSVMEAYDLTLDCTFNIITNVITYCEVCHAN